MVRIRKEGQSKQWKQKGSSTLLSSFDHADYIKYRRAVPGMNVAHIPVLNDPTTHLEGYTENGAHLPHHSMAKGQMPVQIIFFPISFMD